MIKITKSEQGFTLIELLIVVAVIGILAMIAYPSYTKQVQKSKRADAHVALTEIVQLQETYFLKNNSYAMSLSQLGYNETSSDGLYGLSISSVTPSDCAGVQANSCSGFVASASAVSTKQQAHDKDCQLLTLSHTGVKSAKNNTDAISTVCW